MCVREREKEEITKTGVKYKESEKFQNKHKHITFINLLKTGSSVLKPH